MKLIEIKMKNIGPYKQEFINFETTTLQNVILLCGNNGAGKTTILKAIKIGLFGSYLYSSKTKTGNNAYIEDVKSVIRNSSNKAEISIKFSIVEDYKENKYTFIRKWDLSNNFKETIIVYKNNVCLDDKKKIDTIDYINTYFTPTIIDSIMFDGEKIIGLIDNDMLSVYIRDAVLNLFGLNHCLELISDIENYMKKEVKKEQLSFDEINLMQLENDIKNTKNTLSGLKKRRESLIKLCDQIQYEIDQSIDLYSELGGLDKDKIIQLKSYVNELEAKKDLKKFVIKNFIENDLMFVLNEKLIQRTMKQIKKEEPLRLIESLETLTDSKLINSDEKEQLKLILNRMNSMDCNASIIGFDKVQTDTFESYLGHISEGVSNYKNLLSNTKENGLDLKVLKDKLDINQSDDLILMMEKIKIKSEELQNLKNEILRVEESFDLEKNNYSIMIENKNQLEEIIFKQKKVNNSYVLAKKYMSACQRFYNEQIDSILLNVSEMSTKLITSTYRKKNYITKVHIDSDFNIKIFEKDVEKNLSQLSAGEKQLFVAAVLVTIINLSSRNMFMIFDTPAGRLDSNHMVNFYDKIMVNSSNQVIIMPTSKEINDEVIDTIRTKVSTCYTIDYKEKGYSEITEGIIFNKEW